MHWREGEIPPGAYFAVSASGNISQYTAFDSTPIALGTVTNNVKSIIFFDGALFVGEHNDVAGSVIRRFNGLTWDVVLPNYTAFGSHIDHLYIYQGELWVHVGFRDFWGSQSNVLKYNSSTEVFDVIDDTLVAQQGRSGFTSEGGLRVYASNDDLYQYNGSDFDAAGIDNSSPRNWCGVSENGIINGGKEFSSNDDTFTRIVADAVEAIDSEVIGSPSRYRWRASSVAINGTLSQCFPLLMDGVTYGGGAEYDGASLTWGVLSLVPGASSMLLEADDAVHGLAADVDGQLIIGGEFSTLNGEDADSLVLYNPTSGAVTEFVTPPNGVIALYRHVSTTVAPVFSPVADGVKAEGAAYSVTVVVIGGDPSAIELVEAPSGATLDSDPASSTFGLVQWTAANPGDNDFTVYAANGGGLGKVSWTVVVQDDPPIVDSISDTIAFEHSVYLEPLSHTGDAPVVWTLVTGPVGAFISASNVLTWPDPTPLGAVSFTVRATNEVGSDDESWNVTVI